MNRSKKTEEAAYDFSVKGNVTRFVFYICSWLVLLSRSVFFKLYFLPLTVNNLRELTEVQTIVLLINLPLLINFLTGLFKKQ